MIKSFFTNSLIVLALILGISNDIVCQIPEREQVEEGEQIQDPVQLENEDSYSILSSFSGEPGKAAVFGLLAPGGGQLYNKRYVKSIFFIGAEIGAIAFAINRGNYFKRLDEDWQFLLDETNTGLPSPNFNLTEVNTIAAERTSAREIREFAWLGVGVLHLFVVAEAFVDRHLMNFDVSDDLSLHLSPDLTRGLTLVISLN